MSARPAGPLRRALRYEWGMWRSLTRWVLRRRPAGDGAGDRFGYAQVVTPVIWTFVGVSAVEVVAVHLLVPWPAVRDALLVVGVYGLLWMVGMLASLRVHPHLVDERGIRLRHGATLLLDVPWAAVERVGARRRATEGVRALRVTEEAAGRVLTLQVGNQTTVDLVLRRPLPLLADRGDDRPVDVVRVHADDPAALVRRVRAGLAPAGGVAPAR
ncbi:hypothetical protein ACI8AC_21825 [Geodermatophilus sp. SYSU D00758]